MVYQIYPCHDIYPSFIFVMTFTPYSPYNTRIHDPAKLETLPPLSNVLSWCRSRSAPTSWKHGATYVKTWKARSHNIYHRFTLNQSDRTSRNQGAELSQSRSADGHESAMGSQVSWRKRLGIWNSSFWFRKTSRQGPSRSFPCMLTIFVWARRHGVITFTPDSP